MNVQARDQRFPNERFATASVTVNVIRPRSPPVFVDTPYTTIVSETVNVATSIYRVTAVDADLAVCIFMTYFVFTFFFTFCLHIIFIHTQSDSPRC